MKTWLILPFLLLFSSIRAELTTPVNWTVVKNSPPLSYTAEFPIKKEETVLGKVIRTGLCTPTYWYDLYDANETMLVRGITRFFSLGIFFDWGMDIDLYSEDNLIGMIQGKVFTKSRAKFVFYDNRGDEVAHAFLNDENASFLILSAKNTGKVIGELTGKAFGDASSWEMKINPSAASDIDEKMLQLFAGFACDYHKSFLRPPPRPINIHYAPRFNRRY